MLSEDPTLTVDADRWPALAAHIPDFLRRNLRGRTTAELTLHTLVALLHDQGRTDELTIRVGELARVVVRPLRWCAGRRAGWVARPAAPLRCQQPR
jgi:hypothetical protein